MIGRYDERQGGNQKGLPKGSADRQVATAKRKRKGKARWKREIGAGLKIKQRSMRAGRPYLPGVDIESTLALKKQELKYLHLATANVGKRTKGWKGGLLRTMGDKKKLPDVMVLTETGASRQLEDGGGHKWRSSAKKMAGVMMGLSPTLHRLVKDEMSTTDGRCVAVTVQFPSGLIGFAGVYMHSGLEQMKADDPQVERARRIYKKLGKFFTDCSCKASFVLGDMNETLRPEDRASDIDGKVIGAANVRNSFRTLCTLAGCGYNDAYSELHDSGGYTNKHVRAELTSYSRIDMVWYKSGYSRAVPSAMRVEVVAAWTRPNALHKDGKMKHHMAAHTRFAVAGAAFTRPPRTFSPILPRLDEVDPKSADDLRRDIGAYLNNHHQDWRETMKTGTVTAIQKLVRELCSRVYRSAVKQLGFFGGEPKKHVSAKIRRIKKSVSKLRAEVKRAREAGKEAPRARRMLKESRTEMSAELEAFKRKSRNNKTRTRAFLRAALRGGKPAKVDGVVITDSLELDPRRVHEALYKKYVDLFSTAADRAPRKPQPKWWTEVEPARKLTPVQSNFLLQPFTANEFYTLIQDCKPHTSPGPDGISAALWQLLAVDGERETTTVFDFLMEFANAMLVRRDTIPHLRESILTPIWKKDKSKHIKNLRPVTLQNEIGKLMWRGLTRRLTRLLAKQGVIDSAQEACLQDRSTGGCITTVRAMLEDALRKRLASCRGTRGKKRSDCHSQANSNEGTILLGLYDKTEAFDSLPWWVIEMSLRRIGVGDDFITLLLSSYEGSTFRVRTMHGLGPPISVSIGVRQGDPLSALLFVIVMDVLHVGCRKNPLYEGMSQGYKLSLHKTRGRAEYELITSKGFADDTITADITPDGFKRTNEWVCEFSTFACLRISLDKTTFTGVIANGTKEGRHWTDVIEVQGVEVETKKSTALKYLGIYLDFQLSWRKMKSAVYSIVINHVATCEAYQLTLAPARVLLGDMLRSVLDYRLRFMGGAKSLIKGCDAMVSRALLEAMCRSVPSLRGGSFKYIRGDKLESSFMGLICGLVMPTSLLAASRSQELNYLLNSEGSAQDLVREQFLRLQRKEGGYQTMRGTLKMAEDLGVTWSRAREAGSLRHGRYSLEGKLAPWSGLPPGTKSLQVPPRGTEAQLAPGLIGSFGQSKEPQDVVSVSDGSRMGDKVGSAMIFVDESLMALKDNLHESADSGQARITLSAALKHTVRLSGNEDNYAAEALAQTMARMAWPLSYHVTHLSDAISPETSRSSFESLSMRKQLEVQCRQFFRVANRLDEMRQHAGGSFEVKWVKSHTEGWDTESLLLSGADRLAKGAALGPTTGQEEVQLLLELGRDPFQFKVDGSYVTYGLKRHLKERRRKRAIWRWREKVMKDRKYVVGEEALTEMARWFRAGGTDTSLSSFAARTVGGVLPTEDRRVRVGDLAVTDLSRHCSLCGAELVNGITNSHFHACSGLWMSRRRTQTDLVRLLMERLPKLAEQCQRDERSEKIFFLPDGTEVKKFQEIKSVARGGDIQPGEASIARAAVWHERATKRAAVELGDAPPPFSRGGFLADLTKLVADDSKRMRGATDGKGRTGWHEWDEQMLYLALNVTGCTFISHSNALSADPRFHSFGIEWDRPAGMRFGGRRNGRQANDFRYNHRMSFVAPPNKKELHVKAAKHLEVALEKAEPMGVLAILESTQALWLCRQTHRAHHFQWLAVIPAATYGPMVESSRRVGAGDLPDGKYSLGFPSVLLLVQNEKAKQLWPVDWMQLKESVSAWRRLQCPQARLNIDPQVVGKQPMSGCERLVSFVCMEEKWWRATRQEYSRFTTDLQKWERRRYDPRLAAAGVLPSYLLHRIREHPGKDKSALVEGLRSLLIRGCMERWDLFYRSHTRT